MTLALIYLVASGYQQGLGARAWKGFDLNVLTRLYKKGYIKEPKVKEMTLYLTEEGFKRAAELFRKHFGQTEDE
jgi:hypothetical protein